MLWGRPLLPWQRNLRKFGLFFDKIAYESSCMPDTPDMLGPGRLAGETTSGAGLCCQGNDICARRGVSLAYRLVCLFVCL